VLAGPAVIEVPTTTVVVPAGASGTVDHLGNLIIRTGAPVLSAATAGSAS
jgi:N-methylhydantoinase A